ncbi:MAG: hypothetical protein ABI920_03540 [Casimicrobiaceae bacterium]
MTDGLMVVGSIALPWAAGMLWVLALSGPVRFGLPLAAGYGFFLGLLATTLVLRGLAAIGLDWSLMPALSVLAGLAGTGGWMAWRRGAWPPDVRGAVASSGAYRVAFWLLLGLGAVRLAMLGYEAMVLPLVPLDTWSQWASKSRVWYEYRSLVPFIEPGAWLQRPGVLHFTDSHPSYPATLPLVQVWSALWLGRWNESLVNGAWPAGYVALGLGFYAQVRRLDLAPLPALFCTYALLSLPFLTIYVALAGLADFFIASAFGLAAASLWLWTISRRRDDLVLAVAMAVLCASLKREGLLWDATLVLSVLMARDRRLGIGALGIGFAVVLGYLVFGPSELAVADYFIYTRARNVMPYVLEHFLVMDNWHFLWYAAVGVVAWHWRLALRPRVAPASIAMLAAVLLIAGLYTFTSLGIGVMEESVTNRLPFEMVPALAFFLALLLAPERPAAAS